MKIVSKASRRQANLYLFYEKTYFEEAISTNLLRPVREDSGSSFHDVSNGKTDEIMTDLTSNKQSNMRAGKGMTLRRLFNRRLFTNLFVSKAGLKNDLGDCERYKGAGTGVMQVIGRLCIVTMLLFGFVFAQQLGATNNSGDVTDTRLERYSTIVDILDESLSEFSQRPERSRERLALASETFELIRQGSGTSGGLIQGLDNTFARADTAITNQSIADFEIQTGLILGGLQRFLYETATREAQDGNVPLARSYIKRVIQDQNVIEEEIIRLSGAADAGALQTALEIAVGQSINNHLTLAADALAQENQQGAYVSLANAYSGFVTVQDTLSMPPAVAQSLLTTIQDVVAKKPEAAQNVAFLQDNMVNYIQFNESVLQQFNADLAGQVQGQVQGQTQNTGTAQAVQPGLNPENNQLNQPNQLGNSVEGQANSLQNAVAQEVAQQQNNAEGLIAQAENAAGQLGQVGQSVGLENVTGQLQSGVGAVSNTVGNVTTGVQGVVTGVEGAVSGVTLGAPSLVGNNSLSLGNSGQQANGLQANNQGASGLSLNQPTANGNTNLNRNNVRTPEPAPVAEASFLDGLWNGLPKAIVMLLLALASLIPLNLLRIAFGSGSSNWLWVRLAVFLLLLPIMLEAFASLGSVLANITGVSALGMLKPFTVSGGAMGQMIWALTSLIAIGALCFGLWGICKQFGLVGQGESEEVVGGDADLDVHTDAEFQTNPSAMTERFTLEEGPAGTVMDMGNETIIEWEDEF